MGTWCRTTGGGGEREGGEEGREEVGGGRVGGEEGEVEGGGRGKREKRWEGGGEEKVGGGRGGGE